jgi:hypothetical protein
MECALRKPGKEDAMTEAKMSDTQPLTPEPVIISMQIGGKSRSFTYEETFALGCRLLETQEIESAAQVFEQLKRFTDRGPRACIMQAFCEAAALHFENCSKPLVGAFAGEKQDQDIVGELHNAFISYHVGIRGDALKAMVELVNKHHELPTLCLLLGNMYKASGNLEVARKCWELAIKRDWPTGGVALVAAQHLKKHGSQ